MDEPKAGYPGVCDDYAPAIFRMLVAECKSYTEVSREIEAVYNQKISPSAISKFWAKHINTYKGITHYDGITAEPQTLLGVVAPMPMPSESEKPETVEDNPPRDMTAEEEYVLLEKLGYDTELYYVYGGKHWKSREGGEYLNSYDIRLKPTVGSNESETDESFNLPLLFAEAKKALPQRKVYSAPENRTANVVVWADPQTGKVDKNGGIQDQLDRVYSIHQKLDEYVAGTNANKALFLDAGDGVEGFENTSSQMFTNGLSLMDQIDLEATYEQDYIRLLLATHDNVEVYGIDSNHCKWRSGKGTLGQPKDDWGRFIKRMLQKSFNMNEELSSRLLIAEPGDWERTMNIDVYGTGVGLAHGDQVNNIDAMPKWWAGQSHGGHALADSHLLVTGHFHHFLMRQTGRHRDGRQKYHIGAPTLDNGSAWFEGQSGESSDPGLIVFQIDERDGFNFDSLTLLRG